MQDLLFSSLFHDDYSLDPFPRFPRPVALVLLAFTCFLVVFIFNKSLDWIKNYLHKRFAFTVALEFILSLNLNISKLPALSTLIIFEETIHYSNSRDTGISLKCYIFAILTLGGFLGQRLFVCLCLYPSTELVKGSKFHIYAVTKNSLSPPYWFFCWQTSIPSLWGVCCGRAQAAFHSYRTLIVRQSFGLVNWNLPPTMS